MQIPECVVCLLFTYVGSYSAFAADDIASIVYEELPGLVGASWLGTFEDTSVVHHLKLLQEKLNSVLDVLLWNFSTTFFVWANATLLSCGVLGLVEDFGEVVGLVTVWTLDLKVGDGSILKLLSGLSLHDWI